jgi:hypothetical protein
MSFPIPEDFAELGRQMSETNKMKTINKFTSSILKGMRFTKSTYLIAAVFLLAGVAGDAQAQIDPPVCSPSPGPDCRKVIEFWNNTDHAVFPVIQAGIQNPDPWLQALFQDNGHSYAETHYSRIYVNPVDGIPAHNHVSVTVPWYSTLRDDDDVYADWYNGGRIVLFDSKEALDMATNDPDCTPDQCSQPLQFTGDSHISCPDCSELKFYKAKLAYKAKYPFQLNEYTFAGVATPPNAPPYIEDLDVGYNVSCVDQIYLPIALAPCRTEPCNGKLDASAFRYLGTTKAVSDFRMILTNFSDTEGWPQYLPVPGIENNIRLPGAYDVLVDRVNVVEKGQPSYLTPIGQSVKDLIAQWKTCTSDQANRDNCPQFELYKEINNYFTGNYANYRAATNAQCPPSDNYPIPPSLTTLNIMPYVYGWVPFNSGCEPAGPTFNDLKTSPGPFTAFQQAQFDYIHYLEYNYRNQSVTKAQRFNPYVDLVHGQLNENGYAFSIDDAVSFEHHPGEGLVFAIGGATGLPNPQPVVHVDYTVDFKVILGNSIIPGQDLPRWKSFGVCKNDTDTDFPPLPPDATRDAPEIIVDTAAYNVSQEHPCTITVRDASNPKPQPPKYQFTVKMKVPWPPWPHPGGFDPEVMTCPPIDDGWCRYINEVAIQAPNLKFDLLTRSPLATPPPLPVLPQTRQ